MIVITFPTNVTVFCEMLGSGVIKYPYPKFQFAGIALDELLP